MAECPNCKSVYLARDPDWGLILLAIATFPLGLLLLVFTRNRRCIACGVRFRIADANLPSWLGIVLLVPVVIAIVLWAVAEIFL